MANVIRFLETLGSRAMTPAEIDESVRQIEGESVLKQALLFRDNAALGHILGARSVMYCMILADENPVH